MNAVEFTATIRNNNLAYLNWKVDDAVESARVTMEQLYARLNHTPYPVLRALIRNKPTKGLPAHVAGLCPGHDSCEDCVNGKLTRATARAGEPLARVFTDVHGPLPVQSRHGNLYWVTFIDDYTRFPAVYFIKGNRAFSPRSSAGRCGPKTSPSGEYMYSVTTRGVSAPLPISINTWQMWVSPIRDTLQ